MFSDMTNNILPETTLADECRGLAEARLATRKAEEDAAWDRDKDEVMALVATVLRGHASDGHFACWMPQHKYPDHYDTRIRAELREQGFKIKDDETGQEVGEVYCGNNPHSWHICWK